MVKKSQQISLEPQENLPIIDAHCHFPWDRKGKHHPWSNERQYKEFFAAGGKYMVSSSVDMESTLSTHKALEKYPNLLMTMGWGPQTVTYTPSEQHDKELDAWLAFGDAHLTDFIGVGEIGLDFHHAKTYEKRKRQIDILRKILDYTKEWNKPYILHVRNAAGNDQDTDNPDSVLNRPDGANHTILKILEKYDIPAEKVVWHCFSGPVEWGQKLAEEGFMLSIPASAYGFSRWRNNLRNVSVTSVFSETDSPFQHPYKFGENSWPGNVKYAVAAIAYSTKSDQETVAAQIIENFEKFYNIQKSL